VDYLDDFDRPAQALGLQPEEATFEVDQAHLVASWSAGSTRVFGWNAADVVGKEVLAALIAPRHREIFERVLDAALSGRLVRPRSAVIEVQGLHRDGHEMALELRLSPHETLVAVDVRDVSERREVERQMALQDAVGARLSEGRPLDELAPHLLEEVGSSLGWPAGALWLVDETGLRLRCRYFWHTPTFAGSELRQLSFDARSGRGEGIPGAVWATGEPVWKSGLPDRVSSRIEAAAVAAGVMVIGAVPVRDGSEVLGVLTFFDSSAEPPNLPRQAELVAVGLRLGRHLRATPAVGRPQARFKLDTRNTHLAFSCAFMKFLTVHGSFRDFSGWVEVDGDDPRTAVAECRIRTASVDTRSLERDFHLRSKDFFAVDEYPSMTFRSSGVEPLGDEHFRVLGELTIRDVTRPIRLEIRLEDREVDSAGGERITLSAGTVIDRLDWFLDWERALQAGRWIVGNEVRLDLVLVLVRRTDG
jgi:PAS domain S-box-containing protein